MKKPDARKGFLNGEGGTLATSHMDARHRIDASLSSLRRLEEILLRFRETTESGIAELSLSLERRQNIVAMLHADAADDVQRRQQHWQDHEDSHSLNARAAELDRATFKLREADRALDNLTEAKREATASEADMAALLTDGIGSALVYTRDRLARLEQIISFELGDKPIRNTSDLPRNSIEAGASVTRDRAGSKGIVQTPLPEGFYWVPLASVSMDGDLRHDERYHKVPALEVFEGFIVLRDVVLPRLAANPQTPSHYFHNASAGDGASAHVSAFKAYQSFFGEKAIKLGRTGDGTRYSIEDGRHRIHVARALGWSAIPARVRRHDGT